MEKFLSDTAVSKWIEIVPAIGWIGFCLLLPLLFYKQLRYEILPRITGLQVMVMGVVNAA